MKLGIVITTYNRPYYFKQCLDSLSDADLPANTVLLFVDDASEDSAIRYMIEHYETRAIKYAMFLEKNLKIHGVLKKGFDYLFDKGCDVVMNLDADAIVSMDFAYRLLYLKKQHPNNIISGFNTLTCDPTTKKARHPIVHKGENYCLKHSIGGINVLLDKKLYEKYVVPSLEKGYGWDWRMSELVKKAEDVFVVAAPSCVDHIGIDSTFNGHINPDRAADFLNKPYLYDVD